MSEREDRELVRESLEGDRKAFELLVVRYQRVVFNVVLRIVGRYDDVEDLAQETFIRAFRSLRRFDQERSFSTWIISIATHRAIDHLRRRRPSTISLDRPVADGESDRYFQLADRKGNPEDVFARKELGALLEEALRRLPPNLRAVLVLREQWGRSYLDISEIMNVPVNTVRTWIYRARRQLGAMVKPLLVLEREEGEDR